MLCTSLEDSPQTNPIVGRIDRKAGHGAGRPTQKLVSIIVRCKCCHAWSLTYGSCCSILLD